MELFNSDKSYALLILGQSSSGKTHLACSLAGNLDKPVFLVNASGEDFLSLTKIKDRLHFENLDLKKIQQSTVVCDDLISITVPFNLKLKELLCWSVHHAQNTVICVGHSLHNTGLFSLLNFFNYVTLTNCPQNSKDFSLISKAWALDPDCTTAFSDFLGGSSKYFVINGATKKCTQFNKDLTRSTTEQLQVGNDISQKRAKVMRIMDQGFPALTLSAVLFDWIFQNFNIDFLSQKDLSITMQNGSSKLEVSFVDYLFFLQTLEKPPPSVISLHKYFLKNFSFPLAFVKNPTLKKL